MSNINYQILAISLAASMGLTACGGGSSSSNNNNSTSDSSSSSQSSETQNQNQQSQQKATGTFVDSPVQGVDIYVNGIKTGTTDENGQFTYHLGDTVTFKIGNVTLGSIKNPTTVTPADLTANQNSLNNILVLLQSLDNDNNPDNGIKIISDAAANLVTAVDLSKAGTDLSQIKEALNTQITQWVDVTKAQEHFQNALTNQTPNTLVKQITNAFVGFWLSNCDNGERSVTEVRKSDGNTYTFTRAKTATYANNNCTGNKTVADDVGLDKWHKVQGVAVVGDNYVITEQRKHHDNSLTTHVFTYRNNLVTESNAELYTRVDSYEFTD